MKSKLQLLLATILLSTYVFAGSKITGKITNSSTGELLSGANVLVKELSIGTVSHGNGYYEVELNETGQFSLEISFISYQTKIIKVNIEAGKDQEINIELTEISLEVDEIVITGTKTERKVENVPSRINLLTIKRLEATPAESADEYLLYTSGVNVNRAGGFLSHRSNVTMRGMSGAEQSRVLVLMDGVPVNKSDGGSVNWNLFNTNNISKIEVLKGPGSALYGGNAMGGVINIISKKPIEKFSGLVSGSVGSMNTIDGKLNLSGMSNNKKLYWNVNSFYRISDGYNNMPQEDWDTINGELANINSDLKEYAIGTKIGYELNQNNNVEFQFDFFDDARGSGYKIRLPEGERMDHDTYSSSLKYKGQIIGFDVNAVLFFRHEDYYKLRESFKGSYTCYAVDSEREDKGLLFNMSRKLNDINTITTGFDFKQGNVDAVDDYNITQVYADAGDDPVTDKVFNKGSMNTLGFFLQDELNLGEKTKILAGLRIDYAKFYDGAYYIEDATNATSILTDLENSNLDECTWTAFSPRFSIQYKPNKNGRVFVAYSRGFRPSILDDLCRSGFIRGGFKRANPDLDPEYLDNFEVGGDFHISKLTVSPSIFYSIGKDFMYYVSTGDSLAMGSRLRPVRSRENISKVEIKGVEFDTYYDIGAKISLQANYTYTESKVKDFDTSTGDNDLTGKFLTYVPKHQFSIGGMWRSNFINSGLYYRYKGEHFVDDMNETEIEEGGYVDFKLSATYKIVTVGLNVNNILDNIKLVDDGYIGMGRYMEFELGVKF